MNNTQTRQLAQELRRQAQAEESRALRMASHNPGNKPSMYTLGVAWGLILAARELEAVADKEQER